jgi:hypothetical protein
VEILVFFLAFVQGGVVMAGFVLVGAMRQLKTEANGLLKHIESVKRQCRIETESVEGLLHASIEKGDLRFKQSIENEQRLWDEAKAIRSKLEDVNNRAAAMAIKR